MKASPIAGAIAAAMLLCAPGAFAQAGGSSGSGQTHQLSPADQDFLRKDAQGATYELQISQIAAQKAQSPQVKQYAQMIVSDHDTYNQRLRQLAQQSGVDLPTTPDSSQQSEISRLRGLSGKAFDQAYIQQVKQANQEDVSDSQKEAGSTQNPQIKQFIEQFKQMDQKHAQDAERLQSSVGNG